MLNHAWLDLEGFVLHGALDFAASDALHANALPFHRPAHLALKSLQVGVVKPFALACDFTANTTKVLLLTTIGILPALTGFLAANFALNRHGCIPLGESTQKTKKLSYAKSRGRQSTGGVVLLVFGRKVFA